MLVALSMIVTGAILRLRSPSILDLNLFAGSWLLVGITMAVTVARAIARAGPRHLPPGDRRGPALSHGRGDLLGLYTFIGTLVPTAFSGMKVEDSPTLASQLIYFSFATMTTTGYGDVAPLHPIARSLRNVEAIFGQLYPATLLARLVTLEIAHRNQD